MKLYHGTNVWFDKVDLSKCTHYPDSGRGFFLTSDLNTAIEIVKCRWKNTNESLIVFEYEVDLDHFSKENPQLKIMQYSGINEEWIHFAMFNRLDTKRRKLLDYDIIADCLHTRHLLSWFVLFRIFRIFGKPLKHTFFKKRKVSSLEVIFCTQQAVDLLNRCERREIRC